MRVTDWLLTPTERGDPRPNSAQLRRTTVAGWLARPESRTDLAQVAKTTAAAVVAWIVAGPMLGLQQSFLAPWAALLTVHATVYRSVLRGGQSLVATALGLLLAFSVVQVTGDGALGLGIAIFVGLLAARVPYLRWEGLAVPTTALFVITAGGAGDPMELAMRLASVGIGVGVGVVVNTVLLPPLDDRTAERHLAEGHRRIGRLLERMAREIAEGGADGAPDWIEETRGIDASLDRAEHLLEFSSEAQWWNPRRLRSWRAADVATGRDLLVRLEEGVAQARTIARTIRHGDLSPDRWDPRFSQPWLALLEQTGQRVADPDAEVAGLRSDLGEIAERLSDVDLPGLGWTVYGSLITSLRHVIDVVDDVASTRSASGGLVGFQSGTKPGRGAR